MATENPLAAIPTDQLVLKLLQELVARVEKLEKKDEAIEEKISSVDEHQTQDHPGGISRTAHEPSTARSSTKIEEDHDEHEHGDSRCGTCGKLPGNSCLCIEIPYGYLLDEEKPCRGQPLVSIEDRALALERSDPAFFSRLKRLGTAGVPADGRLPFVNFWSLDMTADLEATLTDASKMRDKVSGVFKVVDFDSYGTFIAYQLGNPITPGSVRHFTGYHPFKTPPLRFNSDTWSAPWKRLIIIEGLSAMYSDQPPASWAFRSHRILSLKLPDCIFWLPGLTNSIWAHLSAGKSFTQRSGIAGHDHHIFHLDWYEVTELSMKSTSWKKGNLRGLEAASLAQGAYTIHAVSDHRNRNWTILVLLPPAIPFEAPDSAEIVDEAERTFPSFPLPIIMAKFISKSLERALTGWRTLNVYLDKLLGTGDEIFDIEAHDNLIFDDDLYTRSRRYFWVINCINALEKDLERNIQTWITYRDRALIPFGQEVRKEIRIREAESRFNKELGIAIHTCNEIQAELEKVKEQFNEQRIKALALRDGLFSASAVMESRASTRLGENVKLLTYVSIFYLPLAFCTSIWSTTDTFGYHNLVYSMVAIGLITYLIVFNLNQIVMFGKTNYQSLKTRLVKTMQADRRGVWSQKGELFHKHRPRANGEHSKPSEWWILVYVLQRALDMVRFRKTQKLAERDGAGSKRKWYSKLLWMGRKKGANTPVA